MQKKDKINMLENLHTYFAFSYFEVLKNYKSLFYTSKIKYF